MRIFTVSVRRTQLVKLFVGLAAVAFVMRLVLGLTNMEQLFNVSVDGYQEFAIVMVVASVVLLVWDIRDKIAKRF